MVMYIKTKHIEGIIGIEDFKRKEDQKMWHVFDEVAYGVKALELVSMMRKGDFELAFRNSIYIHCILLIISNSFILNIMTNIYRSMS